MRSLTGSGRVVGNTDISNFYTPIKNRYGRIAGHSFTTDSSVEASPSWWAFEWDMTGDGKNHWNRSVAQKAPATSAAMNAGASTSRIPANVFEKDRARVTAGLANEVDAVNQ